jgi:long-chain acyl-CoA synthetase
MVEESRTLAGLFWNAVREFGERPAQGWHDGNRWVERSYADFGRAVRDVAHGLLALGVKKGDRVAIWSKNSIQWAEVDFACQTAGFVAVPVYDTLTGEKAAYILNDSEAKALFVQEGTLLDRLRPVRGGVKSLKSVILFAGEAPDAMSFASFVKAGRDWGQKNPGKLDAMSRNVKATDLAGLVYTSGTTGEPKGVMLTQGNFASNTDAMLLVEVGPYDVFLSFLPLSHVFERTGGHFCAYRFGAKVVFARSIDTLMDDLQVAKPTLMMAVPRLYEKMYSRIQDSVASSSFIRRAIFNWAIGVGREANAYRQRNEAIPAALAKKLARADKLVFHKIKARVGGRLRYFVSGGAALSREIEEFFWAAGVQVLQGYGLTETSPVTNVNVPGALRFGSVGRAIPGVQCRIDTSEWKAVTERATAEGEICFKGPNIMQGYWRNDRATEEVFDDEGWFHTGDIGYVDKDGFLFITDRKKEIIVMSNGKKVPPQPIEGALKLQPHIAQACIVGEKRNYIATLIVPNWETIDKFALANGIASKDHAVLAADPRIVSLIEREVEAVNKGLSRYEQIKKFWIVPQDWTVESGELTPSMKLKRRVISERFGNLIEKLYPGEKEAKPEPQKVVA